jgi:hypothetical protein
VVTVGAATPKLLPVAVLAEMQAIPVLFPAVAVAVAASPRYCAAAPISSRLAAAAAGVAQEKTLVRVVLVVLVVDQAVLRAVPVVDQGVPGAVAAQIVAAAPVDLLTEPMVQRTPAAPAALMMATMTAAAAAVVVAVMAAVAVAHQTALMKTAAAAVVADRVS